MNMKIPIDKLTCNNLEKYICTIRDIEDQAQNARDPDGWLLLAPEFANSWLPFLKVNPKQHREDALEFLRKNKCVEYFDKGVGPVMIGPEETVITYLPEHKDKFSVRVIDWDLFRAIKKQLKDCHDRKFPKMIDDENQPVLELTDKDCRLTNDIALHGHQLWFYEVGHNKFRERCKIQPKAATILLFLFRRKAKRATSEVIRGKMRWNTTHQVYGIKDYINKICAEKGLPDLIIHFERGIWGLPVASETQIKK